MPMSNDTFNDGGERPDGPRADTPEELTGASG